MKNIPAAPYPPRLKIPTLYFSRIGFAVDVRDTPDYNEGHIVGAIHLLIAEMSRQKTEALFDKGELIVTYSLDKDCPAKRIAAQRLFEYGFIHVLAYEGSWKEWRAAGYPTER